MPFIETLTIDFQPERSSESTLQKLNFCTFSGFFKSSELPWNRVIAPSNDSKHSKAFVEMQKTYAKLKMFADQLCIHDMSVKTMIQVVMFLNMHKILNPLKRLNIRTLMANC